MSLTLRHLLLIFIIAVATPPSVAQISFTTAVDLALRSNPRVLAAQADVNRALGVLRESRDAYVPNLIGGAGLAYSYGPPLGQPTLFSLTSQSLLYNAAQRDYIRAARAGVDAANLALKDVRLQVEEDTAVSYLTLFQAKQRRAAAVQATGYAKRLVTIVQARLDAGQDTPIELLHARRTAAQLNLQQIQLDDQIASETDHLARLTSLPATNFSTLADSIPLPPASPATLENQPDSPAVQAAFADVEVKRHQNAGDKRYALRPQLSFFAQYSRFSNINNYATYYPAFNSNTLNAAAIGALLTVPVFDRIHRDKVLESTADLVHSEQTARTARDRFQEGRLKLSHATAELAARAELAGIDREIAQNQLDVVLIQLQSSTSDAAAPISPKDEQNARILERQKYIELLDAELQLQQTQLNLLRQNGQLEDWLKSTAQVPSQPSVTASPTVP